RSCAATRAPAPPKRARSCAFSSPAPSRAGAEPSPAAGTCLPATKTCPATATRASATPSPNGGARVERGRGRAEHSTARGEERRTPPAAVLVAACRAARARRGASPVDARSAELLVRRGVHARPRPARQPFGDAALGRPQRELPAALVPARVARRACVRRRRDRAAPPVRA